MILTTDEETRCLDARAVGRGESITASIAYDMLKIVMRGAEKEDRAAA